MRARWRCSIRWHGGEEDFGGAGRRRLDTLGTGNAAVIQRRMRRLAHAQIAVAVEFGRQIIPAPLMQRAGHLGADRAGGEADLRHRAAARPDAERQMPVAEPHRDQPLPPLTRRRRPDRRRQPHPRGEIGRQCGDMAETAEKRVLLLPRPRAVERARHDHLGITRPRRIGVRAEMADETDGEIAPCGTRHHEADGAALFHAPSVGISGQCMHGGPLAFGAAILAALRERTRRLLVAACDTVDTRARW